MDQNLTYIEYGYYCIPDLKLFAEKTNRLENMIERVVHF